MKILRNPNSKDVEDFSNKIGYTLTDSVTIDIHPPDMLRWNRDHEEYTIPYRKDECTSFIREFKAYWNTDWNKCYEDINDIIEYEYDDWEQYCDAREIDPQGKME